MVLIIPVIIIYLVYLFIKEKNIGYLYAIFFMALVYPVMNEMHVIIAATPAIVMIMNKFDKYIYMLRYISFIYIAVPFIGGIINYKTTDYTYDKNLFKYRPIQTEYIQNKNNLYSHFKGNFDNVCFLLYDNYLYKFLLDLPINKYDIILYGNLGYKGTEKMINYIKSLERDHYFVLDTKITGAQYNYEILNYVQSNLQIDTLIGNFYIYRKK